MPPIKAHFDGKVFVPDEPLDLPAGQSATIHLTTTPPSTAPTSLWDVLKEYTGIITDAPPDWSAEHDHYLYGTPKRNSPAPSPENGK